MRPAETHPDDRQDAFLLEDKEYLYTTTRTHAPYFVAGLTKNGFSATIIGRAFVISFCREPAMDLPTDATLLEEIRQRQKEEKKDPCEAAIAVLREAGITGDELVRVWEDMRRAPRLNGDT